MNLENFPTNVKLAFTYNFCDALQCFDEPGRFVKVTRKMYRLLKKVSTYCELDLLPEYSFHNDSSACGGKMGFRPRIHYHGTILVTDFDYFLELGYTELSKYGRFKIEQIKDDGWDAYIHKATPIMKPICEKRMLPYRLHKDLPPKKYKGLRGKAESIDEYAVLD